MLGLWLGKYSWLAYKNIEKMRIDLEKVEENYHLRKFWQITSWLNVLDNSVTCL